MTSCFIPRVEAGPGDFRDCCAVGRKNNGFFGSGVLITPHVVLTAAHIGPMGGHPRQNAVYFPSLLSNRYDSGQVIEAKMHEHPAFDAHENPDRTPNDLAVMILAVPAGEPAVPLAGAKELEGASKVILAGFGENAPGICSVVGTKVSMEIQITAVKKTGYTACPEVVALADLDSEFVVGEPGKAGQRFDSGGPAYIQTGGRIKLAGIIARRRNIYGIPATVLTRVDFHRDWIEKQCRQTL